MIAGILDWILSLHGTVALAIVFAVPALEASAFVGFLFPGEIAVLLGGVLAYQGRVPLLAVILAAVLGAFIGDTVGYFVGRRWGRRILRVLIKRVPILGHQVDEHLDKAEAYMHRRGGSAVFLGRFTAALRVMVPGLAGMANMPYPRFAVYNAAGGFVWGTAFVLLGYFAGAAWRRVAGVAGKVGLVLLSVILLGLLVDRSLRSIREGGRSVADHLAALRPAAWVRRRVPVQSAWLARRVDPRTPTGFLLSVVVVTGALCAWVFVGLTQDVVAHEEAVRFDPGVERFAVAQRAEWATGVMKTVTWLGSSAVLVPVLVLVGGYFLLRRHDWRPGAKLAAAFVGALVLYDVIKVAVDRPRPPVPLRLVGATGWSFPSGHATQALAFWGMVALVASGRRSPAKRWLVWAGAVLVALLVGASRIYLGAHWFTDVLGGYALGGLWLCLLVAATLLGSAGERRPEPDLEGGPRG